MSSYGPWASLWPSKRAARDRARAGQPSPGRSRRGASDRSALNLDHAQIGPWNLTINAHGDLLAVHRNGVIKTLALNDEEVDWP